MDNNPRERLDSWKAIADYLGRDRTTVMRWERTAALPVRRVQGGAGRSVFAYKDELDGWLAGGGNAAAHVPISDDAAAHPRSFRWPIAGAASIILAAALAMWWSGDSPAIANASLVGEQIVAVDASGQEVWRRPLPHIDGYVVPARMLVADIDDDNQSEVLAALQFMKHGGHGYGAVMVFEANGELRWQRSLDDRYTFGGKEYAPAWFPEDMLVYRAGGSTRIAVAEHHHTWWPGVVAIYDSNGQPIDRFVNAGWIRSLNMTLDGRYLLAAGITNTFGGAALAVLDRDHPGGTSPSDGGSLPACSNCPRGNPVAYLVAPWSDLARPSDTPNMLVQVDNQGGIQWHAMQRGQENGKAPEVIIGLSSSLTLVRKDVNDYFAELRPSFQSDRQLTLREWTPARGWRQIEPQ